MKHRVSTLEGALLDAAVARCEGYGEPVLFEADHFGEGEAAAHWFPHPNLPPFPVSDWCPSSAWVQGGPIIERHAIALQPDEPLVSTEVQAAAGMPPVAWTAWQWGDPARRMMRGATPLVAAMRLRVASKYGDEVDLP